jgi:4-amino-4-deoxy-L-arabinose transferase-like glycosyltransferase
MPAAGFLFLLVYLLLRLWFWVAAFPNSDEAYYWLWGQHPALSYYDHPPLQAWMQSLSTGLLGRSSIALRLPNLFSNLAFFYTYFKISCLLYGNQSRSVFGSIVLLVFASPLYFLFLGLAWNDHLLITFTLISAYLWIRFLDSYLSTGKGESWRLYGAAGAIALAILSKYSAVLVGLGFLGALLSNARLRPLLRDPRLYFAGAIALSGFLPILLWNLANHFQSLQYYFDRSVNPESQGIKIGSFLTFLITSFLIVSPFHWLGFYRLFRQPPQLQSVYFSVAVWVFAVSSGVLTILSFISAALYYWNITAYLLLIPLLPRVLSTFRAQIYGLVIATLVVIHYTVLPLSALVSQDGDMDSGMLYGWSDVSRAVQNSELIITTDYRSASALAYELNNKNVLAISDRKDQFDFWYDEQKLRGRDAVILSDRWFPVPKKLLAKFERVSEPTTIPVVRFGVWIKNYYLQKGYGFK